MLGAGQRVGVQFKANSKRGSSAICRHLLSPDLLRLGPSAGSPTIFRPLRHLRSRPKFEKGKKRRHRLEDPASQDWSPAEEEEKEQDDDNDEAGGGAGARDRRPSLARRRPGRDPRAGAKQPPPPGVLPASSSVPAPPPLSHRELSHRCPATILGWPQTRTRIAFGQSVAKPLSSGPGLLRGSTSLLRKLRTGDLRSCASSRLADLGSGAHPAVRWTSRHAGRPGVGIPIVLAWVSFGRGPGSLE
ncbi:PREDICTED: uncharacterized protein LOC105853268 [Condylura cristata]|uniref:uncharacterized protein LOC105853268 n=1 Tax=Condylura cristata TaxID=143302 RepID=UPI0006433B93|nr:PREDICTED: uncharacterized protein LOC105853268 [Condylura cristata]